MTDEMYTMICGLSKLEPPAIASGSLDQKFLKWMGKLAPEDDLSQHDEDHLRHLAHKYRRPLSKVKLKKK